MSTRISAPNSELSTLIDLLRWRADQQAEQRVYTFLQDGEVERDHLTFAELERRARGIGAALQEHTRGGERALLIYPPGLEFITAFYGCLYSGVIAVPVYPPSTVRSDSTFMRFRAIAGNAEPAVVLTTTALAARVKTMLAQAPELQAARLIVADELPDNSEHLWHKPDVHGESLAFLQYTSGSTGTPKGVMVSHRNLLHNSSIIYRFSEHPPHAHAVIWLPQYHDMGLVAGILQPLYAGFGCTFMTPASFLQRPVRWLQTITRTRATITGGPNFAYELCVRKVTEEQKAELDLSSLELATNGSEPVRAETQARFNAAFASCGLRPSAFFPGFGMAEATLVVSSNQKNRVAPVVAFDREQLEQHRVVPVIDAEANTVPARLMISNGLPAMQVIIVEPETRRRCAENEVGEIWVAGESVAQGYWRQPEATAYTFNGRLAGTDEGLLSDHLSEASPKDVDGRNTEGPFLSDHLSEASPKDVDGRNTEGPFLRTGDMGFLYDGELYISGRLKDLIIIRGRNHYPQDIEKTVERCHPALRVGCVVAFAVDEEDEERLVIVSEVERVYLNSDLNEVIGAMRRSVAEEHELQASAIVLLKTGTIPKTSSGKVQRRACKAAYLAHELSVVKSETFMSTAPVFTETVPTTEASSVAEPIDTSDAEPEREEHAKLVQSWLVEQVARELHVPLHEVDVRMPFAQYGMDSMQAVSTSADLEDRFGVTLAATVVYDYPNIEALARYVAGLMEPVHREDTPATVSQPSSQPRTTGVGDIAIIGLGCRFPGADGPEAFWEMLRAGVDGIAEVPAERWDAWGLYSPERATPGKMNTRWGGFLKQIDQFDPYFFQISPREAARMDPQQRLLLEVAWEALEHAGMAANTLAGSETGVFVGISSNDYSMLQFSDPASIDAYVGIGNAHSIAANRLSYVLDLRGPSVALDTACSSSLVAVHMACQSIRNGECDTALAGGVNVILSPELTITFSQARMMSDYGRCRTFDDEADGYVRSEGCGLVVLKGLEAARRAGDTVLAVIRGSAVNQDGRSNGITAPNGPAQEAVIRRALRNAAVRPGEVSYVETHGSSTPLGDPIEVESLKAVMMEGRELDKPLVLGSVKTNIGHLEAAAGIAGLIKTVLCLQHGEIPPHLHLKKLNQHISFVGTSFELPTQLRAWETSGPRIAGVSAFGFGGTNAHVIVAAASVPVVPDARPPADERTQHVLTLSARSKGALRVLAGRYADYLAKHAEVPLADVCATTHTGRVQFAHRLAVVAASREQMRERLAHFVAGQEDSGVVSGQVQTGGVAKRRKLAFLFTGQGAQYIGMGRQLYQTEPLFRAALDRCDAIMQQYTGRSIVSIIYAEASEREQASRTLNETEYTQPALFALEYALAELWRAWGIEPDVVMGHSVGEYVAACVAGMLSLEDGCKLIAMRGRLMQGLAERGEMAVVFADERRVAELLKGETDVEIATLNGPRNTVISGSHEAMTRMLRRFETEGEVTHALTVSHAFHSHLMEPMLDAFAEVAREVEARPLRLPLVCNVTGKLVAVGERLGADYWRRQTREAVQFAVGMRTLAELGVETFLEIGPNGVLIKMGMQSLPAHTATWLTSLRRSVDDEQALLQCVATFHTQGTALNWPGFDGEARSHIGLPTYPFERERCWLDPPDHAGRPSESTSFASNGAGQESKQNGTNASRQPIGADVQREQGRHPLLTTHVELVHPAGMHVWETELETRRLPYLKDHRIQGAVAVPISMYIEMAQAATVEVFGPGNHMLAEIELRKLLLLPEEGAQKVQVILSDANEYVAFQVYSSALLRHEAMPEQPRGAWTLHATGKIRHT